MDILLLPDKFKGSLSAEGVILALSRGIERADPGARTHSILVSDGGDGFLNSVAQHTECEEITVPTYDPLGRSIRAPYLWNEKEKIAFIELAKASGMELLSPDELDVMAATTFGTGLLLKDAVAKGATSVYVGLGGSATNDAGIGMAKALGFQFIDANGDLLDPIGKNLAKIRNITKDDTVDLSKTAIFAVNDVDNPLFGQNGAAYTYASQKGANPAQVDELDKGLQKLSETVEKGNGKHMAWLPGAGAAGGTAYGLMAFLNAGFISGIDFILDLAQVDHLLARQRFDYIITGEGKFDQQTLRGKLLHGVAQLGLRHQVPVLAICGQLEVDQDTLKTFGLHATVEIRDRSKPVQYSIDNAALLVEAAVFDFFKGKGKNRSQ